MTLLQFLSAAVIRWGGLLAMAGVIGGLALDLLVLPPGVPDLAAVRRRLRSWNLIAVVALLLTTAGEFVIRASTMSGGPAAAVLQALPAVLTHTHFGMIWIGRAAALGFLLLLAFRRSPGPRWMALLLACGVSLTTSLTSHAAAWGDLSFSVFVDWTHLLASAVWTGGLGGLTLAAFRQRAVWPQALVAEVARRFSRLAGLCLLAVVGSGAYNAWVQVGTWSALWTTAYGRVLMVKFLMVLGIVGLAAVNRYAILPRLDSQHPTTGIGVRLFQGARLPRLGPSGEGAPALPSRLSVNVAREAMLATVVFACTAILSESTPGRHAVHTQHLLHGTQENEAVPSRPE